MKAFFRTENGHIGFDSKGKFDKYKKCERKYQYTNLGANLAIKNVFKQERKILTTYLCPHCKFWHLTHIIK